MIFSMCLGFSVLLIFGSKTDAVQPDGQVPRRCYQCQEGGCERGAGAVLAATCPPDKPHCATIAAAPNFTSSLTCAVAVPRPCSLTYSIQRSFEMICTCPGPLCNALFTKNLQNKLVTFSEKTVATIVDYTDEFWSVVGMSANDSFIYEKITMEVQGIEEVSIEIEESEVGKKGGVKGGEPRHEALMFETAAPNEDDEDESEGSGLEDELKTVSSSPASPAAPSSFLPDSAAAPSLPAALLHLAIATIALHVII